MEEALNLLSAEGIKIALDDFGTGYASLTHLRNFPIDIIKIDRSFLINMETNADSRTIIEAVVALGRSLDISVVAEGVETAWQHAQLVKIGCPYGQGFLYGKAVPFSDVVAIAGTALPLDRQDNFWPRQRSSAVH